MALFTTLQEWNCEKSFSIALSVSEAKTKHNTKCLPVWCSFLQKGFSYVSSKQK